MKIFIILQLVSYCMTIVIFTVFAGKTCSAVSPLPQDLYANFGGDPFTGDTPHDMFMRQVLHHNGTLCGTVHTRTTQRALVVINLMLHHRANALPAKPFFKCFHKENDNKRVFMYLWPT